MIMALSWSGDLAVWSRGVKQVNTWRSIPTADQKAGTRAFEFEQVCELQLLWMRHRYNMKLRVFEDARDPSDLQLSFELLECSMLQAFSGKWHFKPVIQPGSDKSKPVVHTLVQLEQSVLPTGCHPVLKRLPLVGGMLAGTVIGPLQRLMEDILAVVKQMNRSGETVAQVLAKKEAAFRAAHPEAPQLRD
ncbi:MAG: hypothetical protein WDW38_008104 [Sanguina aurantia]